MGDVFLAIGVLSLLIGLLFIVIIMTESNKKISEEECLSGTEICTKSESYYTKKKKRYCSTCHKELKEDG